MTASLISGRLGYVGSLFYSFHMGYPFVLTVYLNESPHGSVLKLGQKNSFAEHPQLDQVHLQHRRFDILFYIRLRWFPFGEPVEEQLEGLSVAAW